MIEIFDQGRGTELQDFTIRKSFAYYDPYAPEESVAFSFLKFEDDMKLKASIVLDYFKEEIKGYNDEELSLADKERKGQVLQLFDFLSNLKVIDAPVLLKLFNLYRYKLQ